MARAFKSSCRPSRGPCSAPGCERGSVINSSRGLVCNLHYQRIIRHGTFDAQLRTRLADVICTNCNKPFARGYNISSKRAKRPQFCSAACQSSHFSHLAEARLESRFWSNVRRGSEEDCWPWIGRRITHGYGVFDWGGKPCIASRMAFEFANNLSPGDLFVCHKCDNPPCCNPSHLFLGTQKDNMQDCARKGRTATPGFIGETHPSAKLTESDVIQIRTSIIRNKELAILFGVTPEAISAIRRRKTWRHV